MSKEPSMKPDKQPEAEMTLDTAADLAENIATKFAEPLVKLRDVIRVARDAKNLVAAYEKQVPELEGRIAALKIEEASATARVANANARAVEAETTTERAVAAADTRTGAAQARSQQMIAEAQTEMTKWRTDLEADYVARKTDLDALLATEQRRLDAARAEYDALLATAREKFAALNEKSGKALDELRRAVEADPRHLRSWGEMASLSEREGDLAEAIAALESAKRVEPLIPEIYNRLGDLYLRAGQRERAEREWRRSLELAPGQAPVRERLRGAN